MLDTFHSIEFSISICESWQLPPFILFLATYLPCYSIERLGDATFGTSNEPVVGSWRKALKEIVLILDQAIPGFLILFPVLG